MIELTPEQQAVIDTVRQFMEREVRPVVRRMEADDEYPAELFARMRELGLFGLTIPEEYGGLGLGYVVYARVVEEIARVWMSLTGVLGSHAIMSYIIRVYGTQAQKDHFLPRLATGEFHGGLALTEPGGGSDVQAIQTVARRDGSRYIVNGSKMFITMASTGDTFALLAKTDPQADPPHKGMSCFIIQKGEPGFVVGKKLDKLGYRGLDTCEIVFDNFPVPAENLVGGVEGKGFLQVMSGLEIGRINVASRAVGVAQAALSDALRYSQQRETFGKPICEHQAIQLQLADMATKVEAARLLVAQAAWKKNRGERCDLEAGMAKLFASEICQQVALDSMRIHGGYGYIKEFDVERYYRDAPLMIIGEGTNEIQKLVIARELLRRNRV